MVLTLNKSRLIEVDDQAYRWTFSDVGDAFTVTVQSASGVGQKLTLFLPLEESHPDSITPGFVAKMIRFGIATGWVPSENGPEVRLHYKQEAFTRYA
jgi:hypothetical protein